MDGHFPCAAHTENVKTIIRAFSPSPAVIDAFTPKSCSNVLLTVCSRLLKGVVTWFVLENVLAASVWSLGWISGWTSQVYTLPPEWTCCPHTDSPVQLRGVSTEEPTHSLSLSVYLSISLPPSLSFSLCVSLSLSILLSLSLSLPLSQFLMLNSATSNRLCPCASIVCLKHRGIILEIRQTSLRLEVGTSQGLIRLKDFHGNRGSFVIR